MSRNSFLICLAIVFSGSFASEALSFGPKFFETLIKALRASNNLKQPFSSYQLPMDFYAEEAQLFAEKLPEIQVKYLLCRDRFPAARDMSYCDRKAFNRMMRELTLRELWNEPTFATIDAADTIGSEESLLLAQDATLQTSLYDFDTRRFDGLENHERVILDDVYYDVKGQLSDVTHEAYKAALGVKHSVNWTRLDYNAQMSYIGKMYLAALGISLHSFVSSDRLSVLFGHLLVRYMSSLKSIKICLDADQCTASHKNLTEIFQKEESFDSNKQKSRLLLATLFDEENKP